MNVHRAVKGPAVLLLMGLIASSAGCGTMYVPGKYTLGTEETDFQWVESDADLAKCEEVGSVHSESLWWGGLLMEWYTAPKVIMEIRQQAESRGGNTVLLQRSEKGFWGSSAEGLAYRCAVKR